MVFDLVDRTDATPASYTETTFAFLNRAAGPFWQRVRDLIEEWFTCLPAEARGDTRARLRSGDSRQFRAAFWELYCHETLRRLGYVTTCHPTVGTGSRRPDFLAERDDSRFVLEATVTGAADADIAAQRREAQVFDAINRVDSPSFFLSVDVHRAGASPPSAARLRPRLEAWLRDLDPGEVNAIAASENLLLSDRTPRLGWEDGGWSVEFTPIPKSPAARGKPGVRPIGMHGPGKASLVDDAGPIRRAVTDKANAYGQLGLPFVVAIESHSFSPDDIDVMNALFGSEQVTFTSYDDGRVETTPTRAWNGAWIGPHGVQNTRVSAVLVADSVGPWRIHEVVPTLWHHPAAEHAVNVDAAPWRQAVVDRSTGAVSFIDPVVPASEFFGLPASWPGPEEPFVD